jgi:hypothetical protein
MYRETFEEWGSCLCFLCSGNFVESFQRAVLCVLLNCLTHAAVIRVCLN